MHHNQKEYVERVFSEVVWPHLGNPLKFDQVEQNALMVTRVTTVLACAVGLAGCVSIGILALVGSETVSAKIRRRYILIGSICSLIQSILCMIGEAPF